jgi:hypothetical protein
MSFSRHMKIYRFDLFRWELDTKYNSRPDHRFDESSTGYSLTGCAPAVPVSASPVLDSFSLYIATVHQTAANDNLSLFSLSHQKGALQSSGESCSGISVQKWRNWEAAGEADWLLALKRESVIGPLASQSRPGVQRVEEAPWSSGWDAASSTISSSATGCGRKPGHPFSVAALTRRSISMNAVARSPRRSEARFFVRDLST